MRRPDEMQNAFFYLYKLINYRKNVITMFRYKYVSLFLLFVCVCKMRINGDFKCLQLCGTGGDGNISTASTMPG